MHLQKFHILVHILIALLYLYTTKTLLFYGVRIYLISSVIGDDLMSQCCCQQFQILILATVYIGYLLLLREIAGLLQLKWSEFYKNMYNLNARFNAHDLGIRDLIYSKKLSFWIKLPGKEYI